MEGHSRQRKQHVGRVKSVDSMMHFRDHKDLDIAGLTSARWKRNVREASRDRITKNFAAPSRSDRTSRKGVTGTKVLRGQI